MVDQPIREEVKEYEFENDYLSDSSSSSQFSLQRRYLNMDLSKLIDKLEPSDELSAMASKHYYGNVNETIEEEIADDDEEIDKKSRLSHSSHSSQRQRKRKEKNNIGDYINHQFLNLVKDKIPKARSLICQLESETIAEELEEYEYYQGDMRQTINENMHCFKVPMRLRSDSDGMLNPHVNTANLTSSEHSDTNIAEIGSLEDSNSHKATGGGNTPISQRHIVKRIPRNPISIGRRSSTDN